MNNNQRLASKYYIRGRTPGVGKKHQSEPALDGYRDIWIWIFLESLDTVDLLAV